MDQPALLASIVALHVTLTILPGIAAILVAGRAGVRDAVTLLAVGMIGRPGALRAGARSPAPGARFSWVSATVAMLMLACIGIMSFRSSDASHVEPESGPRAARAVTGWV